MSDLFPALEPYAHAMLETGGRHRVYYEECGNPQGQPIMFLHGGPGSGCTPGHRRFFDPDHYRIILVDQRGCGRSTPRGEIGDNTTDLLIQDLEAIREILGISDWILFGGSWGSTLALAYAQAHPEKIKGLILRGVFLATRDETDWFIHQMGRFFPEAFEAFQAAAGPEDGTSLFARYYALLTDPDPAVHLPAALAWSGFEASCATLRPSDSGMARNADPATALPIARLEASYFKQGMYLQEGQLLHNMPKIAHIPGIIVQGRYDVICPPGAAYKLHKHWPGSQLTMVPDAGHSASEPGIIKGLVAATDNFKSL